MGKIQTVIKPSHMNDRFSDSAQTPYFQHFRVAAECYAKNFNANEFAEALEDFM